MSNKITLSCFVHTYNQSLFIKECLNSIFSQKTKYKFEVIIIDDCSTDNTKEVVESFRKELKLDNLHFFSTKKNTGLGKKAIQELGSKIKRFLNTEYIYRIDSDDYIIDDQKFEKQISLLEENPDVVGICHHYMLIEEENGNKTICNNSITGTLSARELIKILVFNSHTIYNHTSTYLYRNIHKSPLPPQFKKDWVKGDVLYNWSMLNHGKIYFTDDVMSAYRIHKNGIWNSIPKEKQRFLNERLVYKIFKVLSFKNKCYFIIFTIQNFFKKSKKCLNF